MPYPDTLPSLTNPLAGDARVGHALLHSDVNDAIEALAAKVGTGTSTPDTFNHLFVSQGSGETSWTPIASVASLFAEALDANGGGHTILQKATVTLSSAQLLDLHNTPITLVAAPGAGKWLAIKSIDVYLSFGTVAYTINDQPAVRYAGGSGDLSNIQNVGASASSIGIYTASNAANVAASEAVNAALVATVLSALTDGDGTLTVTVWYSIEDVP